MSRNEHPNPQFQRRSYMCLNGAWDFAKCLYTSDVEFTQKIEVPFCPESVLSGIGDRSFITDCVYSRTVEVTADDMRGRLVLHFGAVDYIATVYVNGRRVTEHVGGYTAFEHILCGIAQPPVYVALFGEGKTVGCRLRVREYV